MENQEKERDYAWYTLVGEPVIIVRTDTSPLTYEVEKFNGLDPVDEAIGYAALSIAEIESLGIEITAADTELSYDDSYSGSSWDRLDMGCPIICADVPNIENENSSVNVFVTEDYVIDLARGKALELGSYELSAGVYLMTGEAVLNEALEIDDTGFLAGSYKRSDISKDELYIQATDGYFGVAWGDEIVKCIRGR